LVKAGFGNLEDAKKMNSREVLQALNYEGFLSDFQSEYLEINKA